MTGCAFCGRANDPASRDCMDCGTPTSAAAAAEVRPGPRLTLLAQAGEASARFSPGRADVVVGRESADRLVAYDQTRRDRHAEIRSQDAEPFVRDRGSRNGVAPAVRGDRAVRTGQRVLVGDRMPRIESLTS